MNATLPAAARSQNGTGEILNSDWSRSRTSARCSPEPDRGQTEWNAEDTQQDHEYA
jgi:hypothetical protein